MLLKDFLKLWIRFENNEVIIIDRRDAKSYYNLKLPSEILLRKVSAFYIEDNKTVIRVN